MSNCFQIKAETLSIKIICIHKKCFSNTNSFIELPLYILNNIVSVLCFLKIKNIFAVTEHTHTHTIHCFNEIATFIDLVK